MIKIIHYHTKEFSRLMMSKLIYRYMYVCISTSTTNSSARSQRIHRQSLEVERRRRNFYIRQHPVDFRIFLLQLCHPRRVDVLFGMIWGFCCDRRAVIFVVLNVKGSLCDILIIFFSEFAEVPVVLSVWFLSDVYISIFQLYSSRFLSPTE